MPSVQTAISVATSGRTFLTTLHGRDAVDTKTSLRNLGMDDYKIATNLGLVTARRLVHMLGPECKVQGVLSEIEKNGCRGTSAPSC